MLIFNIKKKRVLFITGTRADYGKLKPLIKSLENDDDFEAYVFVCGMHMLKTFGETCKEILKDDYKNVYLAQKNDVCTDMGINLSKTVCELTEYICKNNIDLIVVHGDRGEALAGAIVGITHNIRVAHIEGGEVSGTIDESIRHAVSKLAHIHFVCTDDAVKRLKQLGEEQDRVFLIGSPDIDVMLKGMLPDMIDVKKKYSIDFNEYGILLYHPVVTENNYLKHNIEEVVNAVFSSGKNYIVIYPNNDIGYQVIIEEYKRFEKYDNIKVYPSIDFESFLTLLKNANFILGNSSAGIRESGVYGIPAIDIGTRQNGRYNLDVVKNIQHVNEDRHSIINAIDCIDSHRVVKSFYGSGSSASEFAEILKTHRFWEISLQKKFVDYKEVLECI